MEWGRAKKFVIILLVLLNVALGGLNYRQRQKNTLTAAQERAIFEVLSQNGISMYTELPVGISSMPRIRAKMPEYSKETLERLFFNGEKTVVTVQGEKKFYRGEEATLTLQGAYGVWERKASEPKEGSRQEAERIAQRFMDGTEHFFGTYGEAVVTEVQQGIRVDYFGQYRRDKIFANYFSFLITGEEIAKISFHYAPIQGYGEEKRAICYPDEALLTFMRERKKEETTPEATIQLVELGYERREKSDTAEDGIIYLEPCYRIHVMDEEKPYLIDAYTCQMIHKE